MIYASICRLKLSLLKVTQCSITAGRRFSEVELKVLLTHVSNILCYIYSYGLIPLVVLLYTCFVEILFYCLYIGVPSVCFGDTWSPRVQASYNRAADSPTKCSSEYNVQKTSHVKNCNNSMSCTFSDPLLLDIVCFLNGPVQNLRKCCCRLVEFVLTDDNTYCMSHCTNWMECISVTLFKHNQRNV